MNQTGRVIVGIVVIAVVTVILGLAYLWISGGSVGQYAVGGTLSWEIDVWGRIRRQIESDSAAAQARRGGGHEGGRGFGTRGAGRQRSARW